MSGFGRMKTGSGTSAQNQIFDLYFHSERMALTIMVFKKSSRHRALDFRHISNGAEPEVVVFFVFTNKRSNGFGSNNGTPTYTRQPRNMRSQTLLTAISFSGIKTNL